jgi:hypothetical protein
MNHLKVVFFIFLLTQITSAQNTDHHAIADTTSAEVGERGRTGEDDIKFYVIEDEQQVIAMQNDKVKWLAPIIATCGKPNTGKPKIRNIKITSDKLMVTYGKHASAEIDIKTGKITCLGED